MQLTPGGGRGEDKAENKSEVLLRTLYLLGAYDHNTQRDRRYQLRVFFHCWKKLRNDHHDFSDLRSYFILDFCAQTCRQSTTPNITFVTKTGFITAINLGCR